MALRVENPIFPPRSNFIAKGQWNDDKKQDQIAANATRTTTGSTNLHTVTTGKVFFLTQLVLREAGGGYNITVDTTNLGTIFGTRSTAAGVSTHNFYPAIKLEAGDIISFTINANNTTIVTILGMEESP